MGNNPFPDFDRAARHLVERSLSGDSFSHNQSPERVRGGCFSIWLFGGLIGVPLFIFLDLFFGDTSAEDKCVTLIFNIMGFSCYWAIWNWKKGGVYGLYSLATVRVLFDLFVIVSIPYADFVWFDIVWVIISIIVMAVLTRPLFEPLPDYAIPSRPQPPPFTSQFPPGCPPACRGASLEGVDFRGADLTQANFFLANLQEANLAWADLSAANLERAELRSANLEGAKLVRANLLGTNMSGARLNGAILYGANLWRAHLYSADLTGAKYNPDTKWPTDFDPEQAGAISQE